MSYPDEALQRARAIVDTVKPIFSGNGDDAQGAALVELLALFLAGHPAPVREVVLALHIETVRRMVPVVERELFGPAGHPGSGMRPI